MEKILYICDSTDFLSGSFDFASYLAKKANAVLVGVILENLDWEEVPVAKRLGHHAYIDYTISTALPENEQRRAETELEVKKFKDACIAKEVKYKVHIDRGDPLSEILSESRYADLIIIDAGVSIAEKDKEVPSGFVRHILEQSECPVIVAPEYFDTLSEIIMTYDGTKNAVHAIKLFTYLFPEFKELKTTLLEVISEEDEDVTEKYKLHEWLGMHYADVELIALKGDEDLELGRYLLQKHNALIVMDGFSRSAFIRLFSPSVSEPLLRVLRLPVFISHTQ